MWTISFFELSLKYKTVPMITLNYMIMCFTSLSVSIGSIFNIEVPVIVEDDCVIVFFYTSSFYVSVQVYSTRLIHKLCFHNRYLLDLSNYVSESCSFR